MALIPTFRMELQMVRWSISFDISTHERDILHTSATVKALAGCLW